MKCNRGIAVMMLLLALPLLLSLLKITFEISALVFQKQKMREECFSAALTGLKNNLPEAARDMLAMKLPESAVTEIPDPDRENSATDKTYKNLVFNLKNEKTGFNCGARAIWKNGTWHYEIILDKF